MVRAVAATGAVITSARIILAAVFCVLGVLPLIVLTLLGITVGIGIGAVRVDWSPDLVAYFPAIRW